LQSRVYYYQGLVEGSATHWRKALILYLQAYEKRQNLTTDKDELFTAEVLRKLGRVESKLRHKEKALGYFKQELALETHLLGSEHYRLTKTKLEIIKIIHMKPQMQGYALDMLNSLKKTVIDTYGIESKPLISINYYLSQLMLNRGQLKKGIQKLTDNLALIEQLYTKKSRTYIFASYNLALALFMDIHDEKKSKKYFEESINFASEIWPKDNNSLNYIKLYYSYCLIENGELVKAINILKKLEVFFSVGHGKDKENLAATQQAMAIILLNTNKNEAIDLFRKSSEVITNNYSENSVIRKAWYKYHELFN
ncbi:MAG: hypothetical protein ACWA5R_08870, partial [bacterium]